LGVPARGRSARWPERWAASPATVTSTTGVCRKARAVEGACLVAISSDGRILYLTSRTENGASLFRVAY